MLERHHLGGLGPEGDPEDSVLAAEGVGDRRLTYPPPHADPGTLLDALGKAVDEQSPQSPHPPLRRSSASSKAAASRVSQPAGAVVVVSVVEVVGIGDMA